MAKKKTPAAVGRPPEPVSAGKEPASGAPSLLAGPLPLCLILLVALGLRVWGITWGLPAANHIFSYHPDETVVLGASWRTMSLSPLHLLPHFYNYGSLQLYLILIANTIARTAKSDLFTPYLVGRFVTLGMGVGTVAATASLGSRLWGRRCGLLAGLLLAVTPLHAQHSHFMTVDVPGTLWVVLALLATVDMLDGPRPWRAAIVAGILAGLGCATKYNLAVVLLAPIAGAALIKRSALLVALLPAAAGAFVVACPGCMLEYGKFLSGIRFETVHVGNTHDSTFASTGNGFLFHLTHNLDPGQGAALLLLSLAAVAYAAWKRQRGDILLGSFALPYYVLIGLAAVRYARYVIPLLPILALWSARLLAELSRLKSPAKQTYVLLAAALVCAATLVDCIALIRPMAADDTRDQAASFLNQTPAATVGFATNPWFAAPPIDPYFAAPGVGQWRTPQFAAQTPAQTLARIAYSGTDWDAGALQTMKPAYVVMTEFDYADPLRLKSPQALAFVRALNASYDLAITFDSPSPTIGPDALVDGLPVRRLPHDMKYPSPIILVYARK